MSQLSDKFELIEEINQEMIEVDYDHTEELWFAEVDERIFSFSHKICNFLRKGIEQQKKERRSKSSRSTSYRSSRSRSSKLSSKERAIQEKI